MIFTDPQWNIPIAGNVSGLGATKHGDFAMGCGEMSAAEFEANAGWDRELLAIELQGLVDLDFEVELTGFSLAEVEIVLDEARESAPEGADAAIEDAIPAYRHDGPAVTRLGDLWTLGRHKLICGDAREADAYAALVGDEIVDLICTDPPYNVPIEGHVCGSGRIRHRNFAMGVGEMNKAQFTRFLVNTLGPAAARCRDGAIAYVFMDWRRSGPRRT
jgi:hypothetical protein